MTDANWNFKEIDFGSQSYGSSIRGGLDTAKNSEVVQLAREALQNSCDAQNKPENASEKIKIIISKIELTGKFKQKFIKDLNLNEIRNQKDDMAELRRGTIFDYKDDEGALKILLIEDYNTHGLYGSFEDNDYIYSCLYKLLIQQADPAKNDDASSGGSFGIGKAVYSNNSNLGIVAAYSNFNHKYISDFHKNKSSYKYRENINTSFMAAMYVEKNTPNNIGKNKYTGAGFTGIAYFSKHLNPKDKRELPLYNDEADNIAEKLYFAKRADKEIGTSIMIIDSGINMDELRSAIEDYWWPKIIDGELDIEMWEGINDQRQKIATPRPKNRLALKPFISAYEKINKVQESNDRELSKLRAFKVNDFEIKNPGEIAFQAISADENEAINKAERSETSETSDDKEEDHTIDIKINKVALIRNPKMVIDYYESRKINNMGEVFAVGVYKASAENTWVDKILKNSEHPSHEKWDPDNKRLRALQNEDGTSFIHGKDFVTRTMKSITRQMSDYLRTLRSTDKPVEDYSKNDIAKFLGKLWKSDNNGNEPGPDPEKRPVSIIYYSPPKIQKVNDRQNVVKATIDISINDDYDKDIAQLTFILEPKIDVIDIDENKIKGIDEVKIKEIIKSSDSIGVDFNLDNKENLLRANITINKGSKNRVRVELISEPYDETWTIKLNTKVITEMGDI